MCIEFDGEQHFKIKECWGGEKEFNLIKKRDGIKNQYCIDKKIDLLRINYLDVREIENILKKI